MPREKSLYYYGRPYHLVLDRLERAHRRQAFDRVADESTVLDLGCGTGELALALRAGKNCHVLGIDLSRRMIDFARKRNPYHEVNFVLRDAVAGLQDLDDDSFDIVVMSQLLHEITAEEQISILQGASRVGSKTLLLDWKPPLSVPGRGVIPRLIEGTVGRDHRANFLAYVAVGGLMPLVEKAGLADQVIETSAYNLGTGEVVLLSREPGEPTARTLRPPG